jgi:hypothetical protein
MGDKTALFLAVFLKKVHVFDSAFGDYKGRSEKCCRADQQRSQISNSKSQISQTRIVKTSDAVRTRASRNSVSAGSALNDCTHARAARVRRLATKVNLVLQVSRLGDEITSRAQSCRAANSA